MQSLPSTCPHCGAGLRAGARFCTRCGSSVAPAGARCPSCGADLRAGARFCTQCGAAGALAAPATPATPLAPSAPPAPARARRRLPGGRPAIGLSLLLAALLAGGGLWLLRPAAAPATPAGFGEPIASATIGPAGGAISAPDGLRLSFPAGAMASEELIHISAAAAADGSGAGYQISRPGSAPLAQPVTVSIPLPAGVDPASVVLIQEVSGQLGVVIESRAGADGQSLSAELTHFSWVGWLKKTLIGAGVVAIGTIAVASFLPTITLTWGVGLTFTLLSLAGGALIGDPVNTLVQTYGLDRGLNANGFRLLWTEAGRHAVRDSRTSTLLFDRSGVLRHVTTDPVRPELWADYQLLQLPLGVLDLVAELESARSYYHANGYPTPEQVTVLIHRDMGQSATHANVGEWDDDFLHLNADIVGSGSAGDRRATVAHEYWHAIYQLALDPAERFGWLDECMATTFESEVFAGSVTLNESRWKRASPLLASGLGEDGPGEDAVKRGYELWPWCVYLIHSQGHAVARALISDDLSDRDLSALFSSFGRALLASELALADPEQVDLPDGRQAAISTGWAALSLNSLRPAAAYPLMLAGPRPLAFSIVTVPADRLAEPAAPVVVRRQRPVASEQLIAIDPAAYSGGRTVGLDDLSIASGGLRLPADWVTAAARGGLLPVAVVNPALAPAEANQLLIYALAGPTDLRLVNAGQLEWRPPALGAGVAPADALAGYRLLVEVGSQPVVTDQLIPPVQASATIDLASLPPHTRIGLAAEDGALRDAAGQPLRSAVVWVEAVQGFALLERQPIDESEIAVIANVYVDPATRQLSFRIPAVATHCIIDGVESPSQQPWEFSATYDASGAFAVTLDPALLTTPVLEPPIQARGTVRGRLVEVELSWSASHREVDLTGVLVPMCSECDPNAPVISIVDCPAESARITFSQEFILYPR